MSARIEVPPPSHARTVGCLNDIGAVLIAVVELTSGSGDLAEESCRAVFSLACFALAEWRLLDAENGQGVPKR